MMELFFWIETLISCFVWRLCKNKNNTENRRTLFHNQITKRASAEHNLRCLVPTNITISFEAGRKLNFFPHLPHCCDWTNSSPRLNLISACVFIFGDSQTVFLSLFNPLLSWLSCKPTHADVYFFPKRINDVFLWTVCVFPLYQTEIYLSPPRGRTCLLCREKNAFYSGDDAKQHFHFIALVFWSASRLCCWIMYLEMNR